MSYCDKKIGTEVEKTIWVVNRRFMPSYIVVTFEEKCYSVAAIALNLI